MRDRLRPFQVLALSALMLTPAVAVADGCLPGDPCYTAPAVAEPVPPAQEPRVEVTREPTTARAYQEPRGECSGWGTRFSAGVPVWLFQEESTEVGGGIYFDAYSKCWPINLRVGGEVTHMDADQSAALAAAEAPGRDAELTFVRVPFAIEYMMPVMENTQLFIGLGPDIIHVANDIGDTSVGMHISARLLHEFTENWGVAVEAGYMWGEVDNDHGGDVDLDNTFIIPTVSYTF